MSFATYPRKGSITRANIKALLQADSVFYTLSNTQQNANIDAAVQRIAALRNSLSLSDYDFNTIGNADIDTEALGYTKYVRYVIILPNTTFNGTLYPTLTVLVEQGPTGFAAALNVSTAPTEIDFTSTGEYELGILWDANNASVIVTREDDNTIVVDITDLEDICVFEIYKL